MNKLNIHLTPISAYPTLNEFDCIFAQLHAHVSDIYLQSDMEIKARYHGRVITITDYKITKVNMITLLEAMLIPSRASEVLKGFPQSWSHKSQVILNEKKVVARFRCNSKSVETRYNKETINIVMRPTPDTPRKLDSLHLDKKLISGLFPNTGMVLFAGQTGSGKTTTLAAIMRELYYAESGKVLVTIEEPVEYNLHNLEGGTGVVTHAEVGRNVRTFDLAMRAALRENPDVIMAGEMRDEKSILIAMEASQTGHAVYSTLHANSVEDIPIRVAQMLARAKQENSIVSFIRAARTFVYQCLIPVEGGVIPIVSYLSFTYQDRKELVNEYTKSGIAGLSNYMDIVMERSGLSYRKAVDEAYSKQKISLALRDSLTKEYES